MMINIDPVILVNSFLFIRSEMNFPKYIAITDKIVSAIIVPHSTSMTLNLVAKSAAEICVLSPHSVKKINTKPERNAFL